MGWNRRRSILLGLISFGVASIGFGQDPALMEPPASVTFANWQRVTADERTEEFHTSFPSPMATAYAANNSVPVKAILPLKREGSIPAVLVLHYWGAIDERVERSIASELNSRGIAAVLVALPYHLGRTPPGTRSGALAIQPDPNALKATMRQCLFDVRRVFDWMASRPEFDRDRLGVVGTSLGAIVTSLLTGIDRRPAAAAYVLGGADLAHVLWRSSRVVKERDQLRSQGYTESKLRAELAEIEPLNYLDKIRPKSAFVVGARHDTVIPPETTQKLIDVLDDPAVLWLDTGHYGGFLVQKRVHHEVALFFDETFRGESYEPPARISAPTVRLGVSLYPPRGLQVAAGIDIWRGDAEGNSFASLQLAPRGPQVFVGQRLDRGLTLGLFLRAGGVSPGLFWGVVL